MTGLEMMRHRAQRGDPDAALHILNHIIPDIPQTRKARDEQ